MAEDHIKVQLSAQLEKLLATIVIRKDAMADQKKGNSRHHRAGRPGLDTLTSQQEGRSWTITISLQGTPVTFKIYTGAEATVITQETFNIPHQIAASLKQVDVSPISYISSIVDSTECPPFKFQPVNESDVMTCLRKTKTHSATGLDAIPMRFFKACFVILAEPITTTINKSISQLTVPCQLKQARAVPIQKTKIDSSLNNFRPISVLPALSKILERALYNQFMDYITEYNILSPRQFGFRPGLSTQDALLFSS